MHLTLDQLRQQIQKLREGDDTRESLARWARVQRDLVRTGRLRYEPAHHSYRLSRGLAMLATLDVRRPNSEWVIDDQELAMLLRRMSGGV